MSEFELLPVFEGLTPEGDVVVVFKPRANDVPAGETRYQPVHVVPQDDPANPHEASEDCHCIPRLSMEKSPDGEAVFWVYRHGGAKERTTAIAGHVIG